MMNNQTIILVVGVAPPHEEPMRETQYRGVPGQEEGVVVGAPHEGPWWKPETKVPRQND